jgi:hypothetical protein
MSAGHRKSTVSYTCDESWKEWSVLTNNMSQHSKNTQTGTVPVTTIELRSAKWHYFHLFSYTGKRGKAIPVTGRGGPKGCETLRIPHFLDSRLTDGGEVVSLTRRPSFTPQEDSWYSFLLEAESTPGP